MFGWISEEKSRKKGVRSSSSGGVQKFIQRLESDGCRVEKIQEKKNCFKIKTKNNEFSCLILSHNKSPQWQPYIETMKIMDIGAKNQWFLIGLNYKEDDIPEIYVIKSEDLYNRIEEYEINQSDKSIGVYMNPTREKYYEISYSCMNKKELEEIVNGQF